MVPLQLCPQIRNHVQQGVLHSVYLAIIQRQQQLAWQAHMGHPAVRGFP